MTFTLFLILAATVPLWVPCVAVLGAMVVLFVALAVAGLIALARSFAAPRRPTDGI